MHGIYALIDLDGQSKLTEREVATRLEREYGPKSSMHIENFAILGHNLPEHYGQATISSSPDGRYTLLLKGYLQYQDIRAGSIGFVDKLASALFEDVSSALQDCHGAFAGVLVDRYAKRAIAFVDAFGTFALHVTISDRTIAISSNALSLALATRSRLVRENLHELITYDQNFNGRTLFSGVERVNPGHSLVVDPEGVRSRKWHDYSYSTSAASTDRLLEAYADDQAQSIKLSLSFDKISCALTGGFDSRVVWANLIGLKSLDHVTAYTHGLKDSLDVNLATRIARQLGVRLNVSLFDDLSPDTLFERFASTVIASEGASGIEGALYQVGWEYQHVRGFNVSIDGHGGPLHRRQILKARAGGKDVATVHRLIDEKYRSALGRSMLVSAPNMAAEFRYDPVDSPEDIIDQFYLREFCGNRLSLEGNLQMRTIGIAHPLLSTKSYEVLRSLSTRVRRRSIPYRIVIGRFAPRLEKYPLEDHGFAVAYKNFEVMRYITLTLHKLQTRLGVTMLRPRPYFDLASLKTQHKARFQKYVSEEILGLLEIKRTKLASMSALAIHDLAKWSVYLGHLRSKGLSL